MTSHEIKDLRIGVKTLICRHDLDNKKRTLLIPALEKYFGKKISAQTLSMALTGLRTGPPYVELLKNLQYILTNSEFINNINIKNN